MEKIELKNIIPSIFSDAGDLNSGIWNNSVLFERNISYLIEAESGKGKSTLCSYLYGNRNDYAGNISFGDKNIKGFNSVQWDTIRCKEISYLFQDLSLFGELTAYENIILKNKLTNFKTHSDITEMFERLEIADKKNSLISKMSWGQQQRVAIIRCLCQPFHFILMDEPISHLDDKNAEIIAALVIEESKKQGAGIIATSIGKNLPLDYNKIISL